MILILQHKALLSTVPKLKRRISTHETGYVTTNSGTKRLYNLAFSISSRGPMSAIHPPSCKGSSTDLYDGMGEKFIPVHEVNESSSIMMCLVQENIVGLTRSDNDEEEGLEEKRTCRISGADGNGHVQRMVKRTCDLYVCCKHSTPLTQEENRCCRHEMKPFNPLSGRETGLRSEVLLDASLPSNPPHLLPHFIPSNSSYTRLVAGRPPLRVQIRQHFLKPLHFRSTTAA